MRLFDWSPGVTWVVRSCIPLKTGTALSTRKSVINKSGDSQLFFHISSQELRIFLAITSQFFLGTLEIEHLA